MAESVDAAFDVFLGWLTPSTGETHAAASHRASIDACLRRNFGSVGLFRSGSFGHNTSVTGWSDIDYFAVLPKGQLTENSTSTLVKVKNALSSRFPLSGVVVRSPAVVVPFGSTAAERHEIIPADHIGDLTGYKAYDIPNRLSGWMKASPLAHNAYVNAQQARLSSKLKPVIRFIKHWNYVKEAGIRSFYLELRVTEYARSEATVYYKWDVLRALKQLRAKQLAAMQDPMGISGYIYPCTEAVKSVALLRLDTAVSRAQKAIDAEERGNISEAFQYWDLLFGGRFPAYY